MKIKDLINEIISSFYRKTFLSAFGSSISSFVFAIYNMIVGIYSRSIYNGFISLYYVCIFLTRLLLLFFEYKAHNDDNYKTRKLGFELTSIVLILLNISLIYPVVLIMNNRRVYNLGLAVALVSALFTFISVIFAIVNFKRTKNTTNVLIRQSRTIGINTAIASLITLQDTLVTVGGGDSSITLFVKYSSCFILVFLLAMSVFSYIRNKHRFLKK